MMWGPLFLEHRAHVHSSLGVMQFKHCSCTADRDIFNIQGGREATDVCESENKEAPR